MNFELDPGAEQRTRLAAERTHLASERTFLAWIRTGIVCIGGGLALERLFTFYSASHEMTVHFVAILLILLGIGIFVGAAIEFEKACKQYKQWNPAAEIVMGWRRTVVVVLLIVSLLFLYLINL